MPYPNADLSHFRQLREQAAKKKALEKELEALTRQCETLSAQADACKQARQAAEKEVSDLESGGALGLLYTIAGGKAARREAAQKDLKAAKAAYDQANWELAGAQASLHHTKRQLEALAGLDETFPAAREARRKALKAANLPQSRQLPLLEEILDRETALVQAIADLCAQCHTVLESAQNALRLAEKSQMVRDFSTVDLLQSAADQTVQHQQHLEAGLSALLAQAEEGRLRLEEAQDDLLSQDLPL